MTNRKVLLVEDEKEILDDFAARIRGEGYEVLTAENGAEALEIFQGTTIFVVVTDVTMPGKDGLEVLQDIKRRRPATRVIIMTGFGDYAIKALNSQAFHYIVKGSDGAAQKLLDAIEKAFTEAEIQIKAEREMLSFLTHTLFSSISGGPETVDQILEHAQAALGDRYRESDVYKMINNITSIKAVFMAVANMLHAYRIFVNEPDAFRQKWQEDRGGDIPLRELFAVVLRQTLGSILFEESNLKQLIGILAEHEGSSVAAIRETFLREVFWSEEVSHELGRVTSWLEQRLPVLSLEVEGPELYFDAGGVRYPFLFAILSEVIYNALKYTDCREPVRVGWRRQGDTYVFSCRNTFSQASTKRKGSQKGLAFVHKLTQMIEGTRLFNTPESEVFTVELHLSGDTLGGGEVR